MTANNDPLILVVDDEEDNLMVLKGRLGRRGFDVKCAQSGPEAIKLLESVTPDLVLLDMMMPGMDGIETLKRMKDIHSSEFLPIILLTAKDDKDSRIAGLEAGADDYIGKPFDIDELNARINAMLRIKALSRALEDTEWEVRRLTTELKGQYKFANIIGSTEAMREVFEKMRGAATITSPVVITGESGTGKELIARGIHYSSSLADKPFVPVNCAALPAELIESELFGHKRGAFTGAVSDSSGLFRKAHGGSIFLDEIGDLPKDAQAKLLRVLQEGSVRPVGGTEELKVNVRLLAATNVDLEERVEDGLFREDLYYRITVLSIEAPPLRRRKPDIPLLVKYFIGLMNEKFGRSVKGVEDAAMKALTEYDWPGNVRELQNVIEGCFVYGDMEWVSERHITLRKPSRKKAEAEAAAAATGAMTHGDADEFLTLEEMEKAHIERALALSDNNKAKTARLLGMHRSRLYKKLEAYDLGR
ncbi:MAG: sigma-54 dependent transcriptional regulator [Nitrospinota bacterium]|nr:sigma-54 dependent transcriptional regulator [Nitrospinota bacterium]